MPRDDYALTIEDVGRRLNKSTRTIHRYKDSGRLSFVIGQTQGNPLFFSRGEVEALARELYPNLQPLADSPLAPHGRERLGLRDRPSLSAGVMAMAHGLPPESANPELAGALQQLAALEEAGGPVEPHALGRALVRLGSALLDS